MKTHFSPYFFKSRDRGQALIWVLLLLGVSMLAISALSKVALWKLDSSIALMKQRNLIEKWETDRESLIKIAYPTSSFKRVSIENNSLAIPILSKKDLSVDSLSIPLFNVGDADAPLFNWSAFLLNTPGGCASKINGVCHSLLFREGKNLILGNAKIDSLVLPKGISIIALTEDLDIGTLTLEPGASVEILTGFELTVGKIVAEADSTLFLNSIYGIIRLLDADSVDCLNSPLIRLSSKHPVQLKNKVINSSGCTSTPLSKYWQNLRYLGDLSQKTVNSSE